MTDKKFQLGDYVEVKDRIAQFYERYPDGRLMTVKVDVMSDPDDVPRVMVQAAAYRSPDDEKPGIGSSWMVLPGATPYTRGSELENTETSAWGRAIGALGIGIAGGIASAQEVRNKEGDAPATNLTRPPSPEHDGLNGTAEVGKASTSDFQMRMGPDGAVLGFRLTQGRKGFNVLTRDELAMQMLDFKDDIVDQRVTVWGRVVDETFTNKQGRDITYQIVHADRIQTPKGMLPVKATRDPEQEAVDAVPVAEGQESLPL